MIFWSETLAGGFLVEEEYNYLCRRVMKLKEIIDLLDVVSLTGDLETEFDGLSSDSRTIEAGDIFFAIEGSRTSGDRYIEDAISKGAVAIVTEVMRDIPQVPVIQVADIRNGLGLAAHHYFGNPASSMICTGITGTNGKTTTSYLVDAIMKERYGNTAVMGTLGMVSGDSRQDFGLTTPESTVIASELAVLRNEGCRAVTMEVSSHGLVLGRVAGLEFDLAVFTNLSRDHLDFHGDMESYLEAKLSLFRSLGFGKKVGKGVVNMDDAHGKFFVDVTSMETLTYGIDRKNVDVKATEYRLSPGGSDVTVRTPRGEIRFRLNLPGKFNISNALAAITSAIAMDVGDEEIIRGIESVQSVRGRMEIVEGKGIRVVIDYAHTPQALENLLTTLRDIYNGHLITVVGCGGERDVEKRPLMGEVAARLSHELIITSDNPRGEDPDVILDDLENGVRGVRNDFTRMVDRKTAIRHAIERAQRGDVVVIAGKGHEDYQIIGSKRHHFDDREVARRILGCMVDNEKRCEEPA